MPNFYTNYLVIAAEEHDMCHVVDLLGHNVAASGVDEGFASECPTSEYGLRGSYRAASSAIESCYMYALNPVDPLGSGPMRTVQLGDSGIVSMSFATHGRGMSDQASLNLTRYGELWTLTLQYDTAWVANQQDIDAFFSALPPGSYGVALYGADEGDGYDSVSTFCGLHPGGMPLNGAHPVLADTYREMAELREERKAESGLALDQIGDAARLAQVCATRYWPEYNTWNEDTGEYEEDEYFSPWSSGGETVNSWSYGVNWLKPAKGDLKQIDKLLVGGLVGMPWMHRLDRGFTPEGNDAAEALLPGDELLVRATWSTENGTPEIAVMALDGTQVGGLGMWDVQLGYGANPSDGIHVLSCLLPYLRASVWDLVPGSLRNKGHDEPTLTVRFDVAKPYDLDEVLAQAHELLSKGPQEREHASLVSEVM